MRKTAFLFLGTILSGAAFAYVCPNATDPYKTGDVIALDKFGHWEYFDKNEGFSWKSDNFIPYPKTVTLPGELQLVVFNSTSKKIACVYNMDGDAHHSTTTLQPEEGTFNKIIAPGSEWSRDGNTDWYSCSYGYGCQFELIENPAN